MSSLSKEGVNSVIDGINKSIDKLKKKDPDLSHSLIIVPSLTHSTVSRRRSTSSLRKQKTFIIQTNNCGQAVSLLPNFFNSSSIHIRIFHICWFTFFICFFAWFSVTNLSVYIIHDLNLTQRDRSFAISISSLSTIIFRIIFGDLCDKIGSRYCYILLLFISFISLILMSLVSYNNTSFIIISFFNGIIGASFVITEYHMTTFFSTGCVGVANAFSAGLGNFGGGLSVAIIPLINNLMISWRYTLLIPSLLLLVMAFIYYKYTIDTPTGNIAISTCTLNISLDIIKWRIILSDYRIFILSLSYAQCFGMEITVLNYFVDYFEYNFNLNNSSAGFIILCWSAINIFARPFGGYLSDLLYSTYGVQGRIYCLFCTLLFESIFLLLFAINSFHFGYTILMMLFFSLYVQIAEGIVYAIVPSLPHSKYMGACLGIVGAGGNLGPLIYSITIFKNVPNKISYTTAWIICSISVFICTFTVLLIKFTKQEINKDKEKITKDIFSAMMHTNQHSNEDTQKKTRRSGYCSHN